MPHCRSRYLAVGEPILVQFLGEERPLLATALLPVAGAEPHTVLVAADFATCFAAAWLLAGD